MNPTDPDDDDDDLPELVPDSPSDLHSDSFGPFDLNADDDFLPPPAPTPKPLSTRLSRELKKLDGHLNFFKHSPPWNSQHAPIAGGESDPTPFDAITEEFDQESEESEDSAKESEERENAPSEPDPPEDAENELFKSILNSSTDSTPEPPIAQTIERALAMTIPNEKNPYKVPMSQLKDILTVPTTYEEAFYHKDEWCKQRWQVAIKLELDKMAQYKVWHVVNKSTVPKDRRLIKNKWVFDIKRTGIFRARFSRLRLLANSRY